MKRISKIAKEFNIGSKTIFEYCIQLGYQFHSINTKIDEELESKIMQIHKGEFVEPVKKTSNYSVITTEELPIEFNKENPFSLNQEKMITEEDLFSNRQMLFREIKEKKTSTVFSDFEAFSICLGLDNRHAKNIAREFFSTKKNNDLNIIEAHELAMATLDKYGSKTLSFIISLPALPFKAVNATQIFSELDNRRTKQSFPIIRIAFKNENGNTEKLSISYFAEKIGTRRQRNDNVLTIKNRSTDQTIMRISRNGIVIPEYNARQIIPVLQVFIRFSEDAKQTILNYGLETGECSICGRELTDSDSIRIGIGPVCRKYI